jgi:type III secretion system YscQ/HrcQ family protein
VATRLTQALEDWLQQPVRIELRGLKSIRDEPDGPKARLRLRLGGGMGEITLCLDARLITRLVSFALNRELSLSDPLLPVEPELLGAAAAVVAKMLDDSGLELDVNFASERLEIPDAQRIQIDALLRIGPTAYPLVLGVMLRWMPTAGSDRPAASLKALGNLPLSLPLVVGASRVPRDALAQLAWGAAFLTGTGLWVDESLIGRGLLIAPSGERGTRVTLQPGGKIVLGEAAVTLIHDEEQPAAAPSSNAEDLTETLLEAPVVVRVELAQVSLPANQWARLQPGDIVETGQKLGAEVTLRVAGQPLARGELLNIEGELGVRITQLLVGEDR